MSLLVAASPLLAVAAATLVFRRPPVQAATIGAMLALALSAGMATPGEAEITAVVARTLVLSASAAAVILPGLLFVEVTQRQGAGAALGHWVRDLPAPTAVKAVLLVVALAPLIESLTGFGVSLVAIVPVALALLPRERALPLALLGMNVMPWGTLGLATIIGGDLAGLSGATLGAASALTSGLVFPAAAVLAALCAGHRQPGTHALALAIGALFALILWRANVALGPEVAGVAAGATTLAAIAAGIAAVGRRPHAPPAAAWPYAVLFALVVALRLLLTAFPGLEEWRVSAGGGSWAPLTSPGIPLLLAALAAAAPRALGAQAGAALARATRPVAAVGLFLLMSQAMVAGGLVVTLAGALRGLDTGAGLGLVVLFGLGAGYMTGSNLGGNALLMQPAAALGEQHGETLLFAAVQNSAAGHGVLAAVPIVALLAGLAHASAGEQARLMRFGLLVAGLNGVLILGAAWLWSGLGAL